MVQTSVMKNKLTAISLYSGADNLGDGFIQAGGTLKLCIEKDKDCCETIKLNHPDIEVINGNVGDHLSSLPKVDCVIGGPPCPEFSRAKHDRSFDLCEVNNFKNAIVLATAKFYFMENVQDLAKVHKERNILIDCADYGVPQTRVRRIFTNLPIGKHTHSEFPSNTLFDKPIKKWVSIRQALNLPDGYMEDRKTKYFGETQFRRYSIDRPSHTIITDSREWFISNDGNSRPLTNNELAILQGFRPDFKFHGNKTSVRRQIGNALPAGVPKAFFEPLINRMTLRGSG